MAQSLSKIYLHIIFSTKNRENTISAEVMPDLYAYIAEICRRHNSEAFRVGGTSNHVHIACTLPRTSNISDLVRVIKSSSSSWMKEAADMHLFAWQTGYGAFSLGRSQVSTLVKYIENQPEHHHVKSFKEEFIEFLNKYDIEYNEKYLWD